MSFKGTLSFEMKKKIKGAYKVCKLLISFKIPIIKLYLIKNKKAIVCIIQPES